MLDETALRVPELAGRGYCCSQIMVLLALEDMGRDNPDLVRALNALCSGMGHASGVCGVFSGAACVLGLHAGKGCDAEQKDERLGPLLSELRDWFAERTLCFGGISCAAISGNEKGRPDSGRCGPLLVDAVAQVRTILQENGFDPTEGRDGC